ncbi:hypothetical protein AX14_000154 [Amanita brunnescens Koide BX004]|nr:hypothetical protein AX14_000154 [Amanita brunnescens Koide BX004]
MQAKPRSRLDESSKNPSSQQLNSRNAKPSSRQRSASVSSQDSFAGDPTDPEQRLLSSAKQFQVPLSELARPPSFAHRAGKEGSTNSSYPPLTRSSVASRSPSRGKVLVSASSESDSHLQDLQQLVGTHNQKRYSRRKDDTRMNDDEEHSQNSNASSSAPGSSMYDRRDPEPDDEQATQPTAPSDEEEAGCTPDPPWLLAAARASVTATAGDNSSPKGTMNSTDTKSSASGGRPLLSLIDPNNKWRFQRYKHVVGPQSGEPSYSGAAAQGSSDNQETQPSLDDGPVLPPQCGPQRPSVTAPSPVYREQRRLDASKDAMDIVPDSEPSREEPPSMLFDADMTTADGQVSWQSRMLKGTPQHKIITPAKRAGEQNDDSDDDDVPLAEISGHPERREKERVQTHKGSLMGVFKPPSRSSRRIQESAEVPSSVPEQDALVARARPPRSVRSDPKGKRNAQKVTDEKVYAAPGRRIMRRIDEEEVEDSKSESEQVERLGDAESDEAADEDYQDVAVQASSNKRKRGTAAAKASVTRRKGPTMKGMKSAAGAAKTAPTKQIKRLRSTTTSSVKSVAAEPTRVFGLWRQDGHFYSGTIHILQPDNRFLVKFDDATEAAIPVEQMRLRELRVGDDILLPMRLRSSKVISLSKAADDIVIVETERGIEEAEISNVRIASRTVKAAWKDRCLAFEDVVPAVPSIKTSESPALSGESLANAQSNKSARKKFLTKTGLVVSLSAGNANREKEKESLISTIRNNGGVVLDDWTSVIRMEGKHMVNNNRWVLNRDEVKWSGKDDIDRVFLLADDSSQKPKFLMAIGLGIPCLSMNWLQDSISTGEEKEWTAYMLPQGYSDRLSARISQQVDVDWGNSVHQLTDIMDNAVPAKIFSDQSILCVGADMVPQPKGKRLAGTDEKAQEAINAVARIIMCMGAHRVEAVTELRYASVRISDYNYVVVKDSCANTFDIKGSTVVTWSWVKECLVASRWLQLEEVISQQA